MTIGYVYWNMFMRSGKGNLFELEEGLFLADLGIGKNSLRPARKTLYDDGWLSKAAQTIDPLTGKWGVLPRGQLNTEAVVNSVDNVAHQEGVGTVGAHFNGRPVQPPPVHRAPVQWATL